MIKRIIITSSNSSDKRNEIEVPIYEKYFDKIEQKIILIIPVIMTLLVNSFFIEKFVMKIIPII